MLWRSLAERDDTPLLYRALVGSPNSSGEQYRALDEAPNSSGEQYRALDEAPND